MFCCFLLGLAAAAVVRTDEPADAPVNAAMLAEALDRMQWMLAELTESPSKLQDWLEESARVQEMAEEDEEVATLLDDEDSLEPEREVLDGVMQLVKQKRDLLRDSEGAKAAVAEMTDVLAKASKVLGDLQQVMADPDLQEALTESSSYEAPLPYLAEKAKAQLAEEVAELQEELERRLEEEVEDPAARLQLAEAASEQLARELLALEASLDEKLAEEVASLSAESGASFAEGAEAAEPQVLPMLLEAFAPKAQGFQVPVAARPSASRVVRTPVMETKADLERLARELNPVVGYWEPLNLVEYDQWGVGEEGTIGWLRQSEIKHGRVAMAAFVGYVLQSNGVHFPGNMAFDAAGNGITYASIAAAGGPADQWDAMPTWAKVQIILFVGLLELFSESDYILQKSNMKHYMKGGKPGAYPSIKDARPAIPHPLPFDLYNPLGLMPTDPDKKAKGLIAEINNGRLAMLGIMGFIAEAKIPGAVPALQGLIPAYKGEVMGLPFSPFTYVEETRDLLTR